MDKRAENAIAEIEKKGNHHQFIASRDAYLGPNSVVVWRHLCIAEACRDFVKIMHLHFREPDPLVEELKLLIDMEGTGAGNLLPQFKVVEVGRLKTLLAKHGHGGSKNEHEVEDLS